MNFKRFLWAFLLGINLMYGWGTGGGGNGFGGGGGDDSSSDSSSATYTDPQANYRFDSCFWNGRYDVFDNTDNHYDGNSTIFAQTENNTSVGGVICHVGDFTHKSLDDNSDLDDDLIVLNKDALNNDDNVTIMMWIKTAQDGAFTLVSASNANEHDELRIYFTDGKHFKPYVKGKTIDAIAIDQNVSDDKWHHIVFRRDGDDGNLTIDGDNTYNFTISDSSGAFDVKGLVLAQNQNKTFGNYKHSEEFNGYMDEVKFYDKYLSNDEIKNIYNNEKDRKNYDGSDRNCSACPVVDYTMDSCYFNGTNGEVKDRWKYHINATAKNGATTAAKGTCHSAIFDSSNSQEIEIPENDELNITGSQAYMAWVKQTADGDAYIFMDGDKNNSLQIVDGKIRFSLYLDDDKLYTVDSDSDIRLNKWYHVAGVYYKEDKKMVLYINGEENNSKDVGGGGGGLFGGGSSKEKNVKAVKAPSYIGGDNDSTYLSGYVDELKVYNLADRNLTADDINKTYINEYNDGKRNQNYTGSRRYCYSCTKADYHFDKCHWNHKTDDVLEYSGNNYKATSQIAQTASGGILCRDGNFTHESSDDNNDSDDDVIKDVPKEILNGDVNFTIATWIKTNQDGAFTLVSGANDNSNKGEDELRFYFKTGTRFMPWIHDKHISIDIDTNVSDGNWHHVVWTRADKKNCIYVDGEKEGCGDIDYTDALDIEKMVFGQDLDNTDSGGYQHSQEFNGYMDELKFYTKKLNLSEIRRIYQHERDGLDYRGFIRKCMVCFGMDCWDTDDSSKQYITTKIVNNDINVTINSVDSDGNHKEFNGTVCSILIDSKTGDKLTDWNRTSWSDDTNKSALFKYDKAEKNVTVYMQWKNDDSASCPMTSDYLEKNSTDQFAIRPDKFNIDAISQILYAGKDFNITFHAQDEDGNDVKDYNESRDDSFEVNAKDLKVACKSGVLNGDIKFENGKNTTIANYDEIGDINITIEEKNDSAFAKVDNSDTPDSQRLISPKTITIHVKPYQTKIDVSSSDKNYYVMDSNLSQNHMDLNISVKVENKNGDTLDDFNSTCYGEDVNITIFNKQNKIDNSFIGMYLDNNGSKDSTITEKNDTNLSRLDENWTLPKERFKSGVAELNITFGIDRNRSKPVSIKDINITDINVTNNIAYIQNPTNPDKNVSFYYIKLLPHDMYALTTNESNSTIQLVVYDKYHSHFEHKALVNWDLIDKNYKDANVSILGTSTDYEYHADSNVSNFEVNITKNDYEFNISLKNNDTANNHLVIIHLKTPKYLWNSKYEDYNDSNNSSCTTHYCIEYHYEDADKATKEVHSGTFHGSEVNLDNTTDKKQRYGIKIFR